MSNSIIEIKGVSKRYNITHEHGKYIALRDILANILRNPFKYIWTKTRKAVGRDSVEKFWALRDINLTVEKGEVIGIIGSNGAGKSTLLKILTGITPPTEGEVIMRGKVASLLEVGTGFHPELTGRENIFLNGAILGMTRKEIAQKFDKIVEFSGVEKFIDTPVKKYSSGMYVRLAFSVAAHMEPDILLVDEVLAVGDAEFQKKCLGKMDEVTKGAGRTILFVSHNIAAIQRICNKTVLLDKGKMVMFGPTNEVIERYLSGNRENSGETLFNTDPKKDAEVTEISFENEKGEKSGTFLSNEAWKIKIKYTVKKKAPKTMVTLEFYSNTGTMFFMTTDSDKEKDLLDKPAGEYEAVLSVPRNMLNPGSYTLRVTIQSPYQKVYEGVEGLQVSIQSSGENIRDSYFRGKYYGFLAMEMEWQTKKL